MRPAVAAVAFGLRNSPVVSGSSTGEFRNLWLGHNSAGRLLTLLCLPSWNCLGSFLALFLGGKIIATETQCQSKDPENQWSTYCKYCIMALWLWDNLAAQSTTPCCDRDLRRFGKRQQCTNCTEQALPWRPAAHQGIGSVCLVRQDRSPPSTY